MRGLWLGNWVVNEARRRLEAHRSSFITEEDFVWCAQAGFDFVRIPVGYWLFEQADGFVEGQRYLDRAFDWASKHQLGVIIDFHGLQGSQNGYDHSGQVGRRFFSGNHVERAVETAKYLAMTYGGYSTLLGLQVINEPRQGVSLKKLLSYYDRVITCVSPLLGPDTKIIVSDAFQPIRMARALQKKRYGDNVVMDLHLYQTELAWWKQPRDYHGYMSRVSGRWSKLLGSLNDHVPVMVGEWSAALPTRVIRTNSHSQYTAYFAVQQQLFDRTTWAHSYWTYKAPHNGPWDYMTQDFARLIDND